MKKGQIEAKVYIKRKLYYDIASGFGIYAITPEHYSGGSLSYNKYRSVTIQGKSRELIVDKSYNVILSQSKKNKKKEYDDYHDIIDVDFPKTSPSEKQYDYLSTVISKNQFQTIQAAYPDAMIIDDIQADKIDVNKLKGIKEKTMNSIKDRTKDYAEYSTLFNELSEFGVTSNRIKKIKYHFGSIELAIDKIRESIYNLCEINSFGFTTVDNYAKKKGVELDDPLRLKAGYNYILEEAAKLGDSWVSVGLFIKRASKLLELEEITLNFSNSEHDFFLYNDKVALKKTIKTEYEVHHHLKRIQKSYKKPERLLDNIDTSLSYAEEALGVAYTDEQKQAIVSAFEDGVFVLNGSAGTGKTTVLKGIITIWQSLNLTYKACALSGKAANVMRQNGLEASTIHRALGIGENINSENNIELQEDLIILDEASMTNAYLFKKLTSSIKNGALFIIVGDSGQLSSIGYGDILRDLLTTKVFNNVTLTKIHRQAADSGVIDVAHKIRDAKQLTHYNAHSKKLSYGVNNDMVLFTFDNRKDVFDSLKTVCEAYKKKMESPEDIMDFQILTARKSGNTESSSYSLNVYAQELFNPDDKPFIKCNFFNIKEGDKVIANGNTYNVEKDIDLYNGTMGIVKFINAETEEITIQFDTIDKPITLSKENHQTIELAYAITTHKSQGSSIKTVVGVLDFSSMILLDKQLVYTLVTRTKDKCILLVENNALCKAINTDASNNRKTFLGDIINNPKRYSKFIETL